MGEPIVVHKLKTFDKLRRHHAGLGLGELVLQALLKVTLGNVLHSNEDGVVALEPPERLDETVDVLR